jgi:hypothetical protein
MITNRLAKQAIATRTIKPPLMLRWESLLRCNILQCSINITLWGCKRFSLLCAPIGYVVMTHGRDARWRAKLSRAQLRISGLFEPNDKALTPSL